MVVLVVPPQSCRAGGVRFPWWAGVILGVGLALIVAAVLLTLAVCYVRRLQRRNSELASSQRDVESKVSSRAACTLCSRQSSATGNLPWISGSDCERQLWGALGAAATQQLLALQHVPSNMQGNK